VPVGTPADMVLDVGRGTEGCDENVLNELIRTKSGELSGLPYLQGRLKLTGESWPATKRKIITKSLDQHMPCRISLHCCISGGTIC
jgi:uncharacterized Zn finger protein